MHHLLLLEIGDSGIYLLGRALWLGFDIAEYELSQTPAKWTDKQRPLTLSLMQNNHILM